MFAKSPYSYHNLFLGFSGWCVLLVCVNRIHRCCPISNINNNNPNAQSQFLKKTPEVEVVYDHAGDCEAHGV